MISATMRDVLIEHMDGRAVPLIWNFRLTGIAAHAASIRARSVRTLLRDKMITLDRTWRPARTVITALGRHELGMVLGQYAEILVRAGLRVEELAEVARTSGGSLVNPPREVAEPKDFQKA
jgi:hypothetical protein